MRISLNLATRPYADLGPALKRLRIAMASLAVLSLLFGLGIYALDRRARDARVRYHSLDGAILRINSERRGYMTLMHHPDNAAVLTAAENLNRIFDEKSFSWTLAMEDLETVLPGGVQVTTLEPAREKDGHITLHLRVLGARDRAVELVKNLEHSRRFLRPRIVGESSESESGPGQRQEPVSPSNRVNFDIVADYNPPRPGEPRPQPRALADAGQAQAPAPPQAGGVRQPPPPPGGAGRPGPPYTGVSRPPAQPQPQQQPAAAPPQHFMTPQQRFSAYPPQPQSGTGSSGSEGQQPPQPPPGVHP